MDTREQYDSTGLLDDPEALRKRANEDGFLFFGGLLPKEQLHELRHDALELIQEEGLLDPSHDLVDGVADLAKCSNHFSYASTCVTKEIYQAVQKMELFHKLAHHPNILSMYQTLFDEDVLVHPRHIMRLVVSGKNVYPTAPHQDIVYIHGSTNCWTSWIPIGDCSRDVGNLTVLKGSHKIGVLPVKPAEGAGGLSCDPPDGEWISFDYQAGDVLCFPATMIHKALPTQKPERVRLSLDYRYQPISEPVHEESLLPHMRVLGWEDIYKGWKDDTLKYYWKKEPINTTTTRSFDQFPQLKMPV